MIYVDVEMRDVEGNPSDHHTFGPYTEIKKGPYTDFIGVREDGTEEDIFEISVGEGGYCDTCAYSYTTVHLPSDKKWYEWTDINIVHFRIYTQ